VKTFLIKGPLTDEEVVSSFPLIHLIKEGNPDVKISIVLDEGQNNLYNFLSFKVDVFFLPESKSNLMGVHHFAVNLLEVFNVDVFIDLENSLKSSFLGFSFKAKHKLGYKKGMNSIFLSHKLEGDDKKSNDNPDEKYLKLFCSFLDKDYPDYKVKTFFEKKSNLDESKNREILVVLSNTVDYKNELIKLFLEFEEKKFAISLINKVNLIDGGDFLKELKAHNSSNSFISKNFMTYSELQDGLVESAIVITDIEWVSFISAYLGRDSFLLSRNNKDMPKFKYFESSPMRIAFETGFINLNMEKENQKISDIKGLVDFIHKFLALKL